MLRFKGSEQLRQRLLFSTLSGKPIRIDEIRARDQNPGLRDYEASLLRLIEKVSDGCVIEINETGTSLRYKPGFLVGGAGLEHDCGLSRSISYFLEPLCFMGLFGRKPLSITLRGITNDRIDPGLDVWRTVTLPLLRAATGLEDGFELRVIHRGAPPGGGGEVNLRLPIVPKSLPAVSFLDEGMVKRVRGIAYSMRVSPQTTNRLVDGARGVLNQLLADVYIFTDHMSGVHAGLSPGYGLMLVAETTKGRMISAEAVSRPAIAVGRSTIVNATSVGETSSDGEATDGPSAEEVPEDLGQKAAHALFEEISRGGVVDSSHQALVLIACAIGPEEINEVRLGPLTPYAVRTLRDIREFFGVQFSVRPERESRTIFLSCIGAGVHNMSKKIQ